AAHAEVDILLDTFPYPGGTTTCEALWMGVPTITLAGDTLLARQGASLLTAAGLPDWVAHSEDEYVGKAITFAQNPASLAVLRAGLRERVARSPLFDAPRFASHLSQALWVMWRELSITRLAQNENAAPVMSDAAPQAQQAMDAIVALYQQGRFAEVEAAARKFCNDYPEHFFGWKILGTLCVQFGHTDLAIAHLEKAISLAPEDVGTYSNLGVALKNLGRRDEAITCYRRALAVKPDYAEAHCNLGNALREAGQLAEAIEHCRQAVGLRPDYAEAHANLGAAFLDSGNFSDAKTCCENALKLKPDQPRVLSNLGAALKDLGQIDAALMALRRAVELQPDYAEAHNNLGVVFHECGLLDHAKQSYHQAVQLKPDYAEAFNNLGNTLKADGELEASAAARRRALEINPSYAEAYNNLGVVLQDEGRLPEAVDCYRRTLEIKPSFIEAHSNLIFCLNFDERFSAEDRLLEARAFGEKVQEKATEFRAWKSSATVLPDRLRIGFVSGDLKIHPVGFFLENALSCLSTNL
ncbi:tetratricopeptide repeat protein, partial [Allochromatium humboldtianum]